METKLIQIPVKVPADGTCHRCEIYYEECPHADYQLSMPGPVCLAARAQADQPQPTMEGGEKMTVKEILSAWLTERGYDGLVNSNGQCGCRADDICPFSSEGIENCEPAYVWRCADCQEHETCENDWRDEGECYRLEKPGE